MAGVKVKVEMTNQRSVQQAMRAFGKTNDAELGESLRRGMEFPKARARQLAPKKDRKLVGTIYVRTTKTRRGWQSVLGASAPYAGIREKGGTIRAKRKPWLVFMGKAGHLVQVKQVRQKATPYLAPARQQTRADVVRELQAGLKRTTAATAKASR